MKCPACNFLETKVIDSRLSAEGVAIRRRRECLKCEFRFSTYEEVQILDLTIIKRDGSREPYSREKLVAGLKKSFEKRPITRDDLARLVQIIERDIQVLRKPEVSSLAIGEIVMKRLRQIDEVAYIRFASVYQGFKDAEMFHRAIEQLFVRDRAHKRKRHNHHKVKRRTTNHRHSSPHKRGRRRRLA
ncbi:transcriptional regulator NrdR [Candidatus Uhrbacteria bacterium RIFCSPLOWO2_12_FULL_46_10]|uniref:Transcriptional repressor NrdR n=1 Tax=Candidatus Uhrbacteria bacterium RIFCSPLOWO2_01_FULL_47_25 TaxID=1802402 RepID=A0A1F7UWV4_9BACT|nr:MAG: Transcriptional repressor NrdR [Parcubacteria group bacterium GW2011_GWA2_46_9]OGL60369.1 MAG: transcriptional regulator NrdR [Candidatus Uhrbacteria bacterium RIFCSPHIGHO2_01_FULL_46_23]OGL69770.1 MAG: transcriptional regulator NrdR [Candidatus Uhrbacteria bacterium RIFCSPHIGHO2_02_FULL_47_29]OGL82755.1 MAG: transcriptional regulator NrdR [Candidatus Uhrbacteria bacterium RIFCSPLOWO2_01_FULL_47_25]OGL86078.1 MAG: transcriptional regulator NrdR [Candidatus Uhrbacteria bacterium RIFCSPLO